MSTLVHENAEFPRFDEPGGPTNPPYLVILEKGEDGWGAYVPDLPGVVAAAATQVEVQTLIVEAVGWHLAGLREDGEDVPEPTSQVFWVDA